MIDIWLGGTDEAQEDHWEWISGGCSFDSFVNWAPGQPNTNGVYQDYLVMRSFDDFAWHDLQQTYTDFSFICESPVDLN